MLTGCRGAAPPPPPTPAETANLPSPGLFEASWSDRSIYAAGLIESQADVLAGLPGASVYHLELTLADDLASVQGVEEVLYTNTEAVPLDRVAFHLFPNLLGGEMALSSVRVDGVDAELVYGDGWVAIVLEPALEPMASVVIRLEFTVRVPAEIELNYGVLANAQGVLAYAHGYPMVAVYDSAGWDLEIPSPYGDVTYSDSSFYLVRVHAPKGLVLCTSGIEVDRHEADGQPTVTFAAGPARDFYLAGSQDYEVLTETAGPVTLRVCTPGYGREAGERILEVAADALETFGQRYAPYPYTELDVVATPTYALGIEYPGAFALTQNLFTEAEDYGATPESVMLESVTAHEAAHEWFYNLVGNDQLEDPWLDEALAQFATLQYYADRYGESGAAGLRASFYSRWDRVERKAIPIGMPVVGYDERSYSAIVYGRGPLFIEALQQELGEESFDAFMREYTTAFAWEEATPADLQRLAEAQCGCDLTSLFQEWVYGQP